VGDPELGAYLDEVQARMNSLMPAESGGSESALRSKENSEGGRAQGGEPREHAGRALRARLRASELQRRQLEDALAQLRARLRSLDRERAKLEMKRKDLEEREKKQRAGTTDKKNPKSHLMRKQNPQQSETALDPNRTTASESSDTRNESQGRRIRESIEREARHMAEAEEALNERIQELDEEERRLAENLKRVADDQRQENQRMQELQNSLNQLRKVGGTSEQTEEEPTEDTQERATRREAPESENRSEPRRRNPYDFRPWVDRRRR